MSQKLLVENGFISTSSLACGVEKSSNIQLVSTLLGNFAYYGFVPSKEIVEQLNFAVEADMATFWEQVEPVLKHLTGDDRDIAGSIVYKNFPQEVLAMDDATQLYHQVLIYLGIPSDLLTEEKVEREALSEDVKLKVLHAAQNDTLEKIQKGLMGQGTRWTDMQKAHALALFKMFGGDISEVPFKQNAIDLAKELYAQDKDAISFGSSTDVLRFAAALADQDASLRTKVRFPKYSNQERKFFVRLLEGCSNLEADFAMRSEIWKRFMFQIRPSSYKKFKRVNAALDSLYNNKHKTFDAQLLALTTESDAEALNLLEKRPGEFMRRLHAMYKVYGLEAFTSFAKVLPELSLLKLLSISKYLETINTRNQMLIRPSASWAKAIADENKKAFICNDDLSIIQIRIGEEIAKRLQSKYPNGIVVGEGMDDIFIPTNDLELAPYGRGTRFPMPKNASFIRTCSFWKASNHSRNIWFDNGMNMFDAKFKAVGVCAWNNQRGLNKAVIMSGDPTSTNSANGNAGQLIDIDIEAAIANGARYALWSVLCFSNVKFSEAEGVFASVQLGEDSIKGEVFEPSRAHFSFPIQGDNLTRYPVLFDLVRREMVFLDLPLRSSTQSACNNETVLESLMPAVIEHVYAQPTLKDLFKFAPDGLMVNQANVSTDTDDENHQELPAYFLRTDENVEIPSNAKAFVFENRNEENKFEKLTLQDILA